MANMSSAGAAAVKEDKEQSSSAITAIYKSRIALLQLMKNQGMNVSSYEGAGTHEVHTMKEHDQLDMLLTSDESQTTKRTVYVKYFMSQRLSAREIHNIVDDLFNLDEVLVSPENDTLIIVTKYAVNETIMQLLNQMWAQSGYFIIIFTLDQLQFNILNHQYVPRHEILSPEQTAAMLKRFNISGSASADQLPSISRYDPVAQAIGIRPGEICKIIRPSKTSITSDYYRVCT
jgi:DNA-directed RNA polymerase I, II, and III subunit RPABC1